MLLCLALLPSLGWAQNDPQFLVVTRVHLNTKADFTVDQWKAHEKEYFEKVTQKNDLIVGANVLVHYYTNDNSEVLLTSTPIALGLTLKRPTPKMKNLPKPRGRTKRSEKHSLTSKGLFIQANIPMKFVQSCRIQNHSRRQLSISITFGQVAGLFQQMANRRNLKNSWMSSVKM